MTLNPSASFTSRTLLAACAVACGAVALPAAAQNTGREMGRVISSVPVMQQVAVPRQVCGNEEVYVPGAKSGAGAVIGGIAGGAIGNQVGGGAGRAVATLIGIVGGAALGNSIEGGGEARSQWEQRCSTQTSYETRTMGYNVTYEYAGKQYTVQMQQDPGAWVPLQVTPAPQQYNQPYGQPYNQPYNNPYGAQTYPQAYPPAYPAGEPLPPVSYGNPQTVITQEVTYLGSPRVEYVRPYRPVAPVSAEIWIDGSSHRNRRDDWRHRNRHDDRWP
jgi:uncharacterized protein YcfJ